MIERKIKPKLKIVFSLSPRAHHVNEGKHTYIDIESSAAVAATINTIIKLCIPRISACEAI